MNEIERMLEPETNPYDRLIEPATQPVRSPVILGNADQPEKKNKRGETMEIIPLAGNAAYSKLPVRKCKIIDMLTVEVEEDLLVPDTYPDMEVILNMDARVSTVETYSENGEYKIRGKIDLETMYRSDELYGNNISVLPAELKYEGSVSSATAESAEQIHLHAQIRKIEFRIINERKYKAKISVAIHVNCENEVEHIFFEGIEGEQLHLHKEQASFIDMIVRKTASDDFCEELLLNDEKIRPVKILKSRVTVAENHRQLTKEKLILNQTLWIRVMYLAEVDFKGNLSNQAMYFQGKIDNTQFIPWGKSDGEAACCTSTSMVENVRVEINQGANGFEISGEVKSDIVFYGIVTEELVTDFYHDKDEMTCDRKIESVCSGVSCVSVEHMVRENISLQQESGDEQRILYLDAQPVDVSVDVDALTVMVRGKLHLEAVIMNEGDYTILAKKICDFSCMKELSPEGNGRVELVGISVREMQGNIAGNEVNITAQVQANMNIYNETEIVHINNPCIVRSGEPVKYYPVTVHTVMEGESVWEIGKRYKVSEEQITAFNKEENLKPGAKIVIVR